ncbi:MAG TPA: ABC transporter substrate-binding protein [Casimicrobiaceae bacterium]|nr:ABC transporter substrate-binding protein [Casimicrobiaceae bacterium]
MIARRVSPHAIALLTRSLVVALSLAASVVAHAADPDKVLRVALPIAETGFDPAAVNDLYSQYVNRAIFDTLYVYDLLARPYKLVPSVAVALPEVAPDGKTWTIKVRPGIYFADDPAFKGKRRELTAGDFVYAWKRILDPKTRSPAIAVFDGKLSGIAAPIAAAKKPGGRFDYDAPIEGLQAIDRYTIRLKFDQPEYSLLSDLTTINTAAMAREVVEAYGDASGWAMANPVGSGPYRLKEWRRGQRIILEANPGFRDQSYPDSTDPADKALLATMRGKKIPMIGRIEISIMEESNPRLLAFQGGNLDYLQIPNELIWNVLEPDGKLKPELAKRGIRVGTGIQPAVVYTYFNMEDPVVGGLTTDRIALRRAISMAYNVDEDIRIARQGQAEASTQPLPPNVEGHDPNFRGYVRYDVAGAKALLDKFGYVDRDGDGWRDLPDGRPLVLSLASPPSSSDRLYDELWQKSLAAVGLRIEFVKQKWPDLLKMGRAGKLQMWTLANTSSTPDGIGFFDLLYGPNAGDQNLSRFRLPEFDAVFARARLMSEGPERLKLFHRLSELVTAYAPWQLSVYRRETILVQPWLQGYKYNTFYVHPWQYYDIDLKRRKAAGG